MINQVRPFIFEGQQVRTVVITDTPYFFGKDVARILGYQDLSRAVNQHVDLEDRKSLSRKESGDSCLSLWDNDNDWTDKTIITESGVYSLIFGSKLPSAKRFKHWVTHEVLPSIRKNGMYATEQTWDKLINNPDAIIKLAQNWKKATVERDQAQAALQVEHDQRLEVEDELSVAQPKADYTDAVLSSKGAMSITVIAKEYGMSAVKMNKVLHNMGVQFETNGVWVLYAKYADKGYTKIDTVPITHNDGRGDFKPHMKWTQKGRKFLYDFLKERGILPVAEQQELGMEAM